jgi:spoIIIJ-associated protein
MNIKKEDLEKVAQLFFKSFDPEAKIEVQEKDGWRVKVTSPNSGHLIGKMGETLESIQYVLRLMVSQTAGEFLPLTVDIDDYKEKKEIEVAELARAMAANVKTSGYGQEMRPMSAYNRRLVHVALEGFEGVKVDSVGEGELRRIRIEPIE